MKKLKNASVILITMTLGLAPMLTSCSDIKVQASEMKTAYETTAVTEESESVAETETTFEEEEWEAPGSKWLVSMRSFANIHNDNPYLTYYGDDVLAMDRKEVISHVDEYVVTADHYKGTDFYDLASRYESEGYLLLDIPSEYSIFGGYFYKEGFNAKIWTDDLNLSYEDRQLLKGRSDCTVNVIRSDADTLEDYLKHYFVLDTAYVVRSFDKEEAEGEIEYKMTIMRIILQQEIEYDVVAKLDTATGIAVVETVYEEND